MNYRVLGLLLLLISAPIYAQVKVEPADAQRDPEWAAERAAKAIQAQKHTNYHDKAVKALRGQGEWFDVQRMEVTGVLSDDDTGKIDPALFDAQVKPSFRADENQDLKHRAGNWLGQFLSGGAADATLDLVEVEAAMRGELTDRAKEKLDQYRNQEVNEIVAHSWGTELVYTAILSGYIRPPKTLIVVGVPDTNYDKWVMLAQRTGTQLYFSRADNDRVAKLGARLERYAANSVDFGAKWAQYCTENPKQCPPYGRSAVPRGVDIFRLPGTLGHDRSAYYDALKTQGFLKDKLIDLQRKQTVRLKSMIEAVRRDELEESLGQAQELVADARREWQAAKADEDRKAAKIQQCREDGQKIIDDVCRSQSMGADDYIAYRESLDCEQATRSGARWITRPWPMPQALAGGCEGRLVESLNRASELDPGYAGTYVKSFFDEGRRCSGEAYRLAAAVCDGRTFTDVDLTSFYRNLDCAKSRISSRIPNAQATAGTCAYELRHELDEHFSTAERANELADYYRQKYAPPPPAPPPPPARPPVYHRPPREEEPIDPPEKKCHMEYMGECCGGWVRICPG